MVQDAGGTIMRRKLSIDMGEKAFIITDTASGETLCRIRRDDTAHDAVTKVLSAMNVSFVLTGGECEHPLGWICGCRCHYDKKEGCMHCGICTPCERCGKSIRKWL
jgi:hypothetical protein